MTIKRYEFTSTEGAGAEGRSLLMSEDIFAGEIAARDRALVERRYVLRPCVCGVKRKKTRFSPWLEDFRPEGYGFVSCGYLPSGDPASFGALTSRLRMIIEAWPSFQLDECVSVCNSIATCRPNCPTTSKESIRP